MAALPEAAFGRDPYVPLGWEALELWGRGAVAGGRARRAFGMRLARLLWWIFGFGMRRARRLAGFGACF